MISRVSKLINFGVFHDFIWKKDLSDFKKFNLIYGWNRSGKTTLSRVFLSCERKIAFDEVIFKQYPEEGEFEIVTDTNDVIKSVNVSSNTLPIRVFNKDFIDDNISFEQENSVNPIVYIGEEDIESKKRLDELLVLKPGLEKSLLETKKDKQNSEETKNSFLTSLGREISSVLFDKTYNKTKAESKINEVGVDNFKDKILSDDDKKKYTIISRSDEQNIEPPIKAYQAKIVLNGQGISGFESISETIEKLLTKEVESEAIARLKKDQEINLWVKHGYDLHLKKEEKDTCIFCENKIKVGYFTTLSKHFSKSYENLLSEATTLSQAIQALKVEKIPIENNRLYPDLRKRYSDFAGDANAIIDETNNWIINAEKAIRIKKDNPLTIVSLSLKPITNKKNYYNSITNAVSDSLDKYEPELSSSISPELQKSNFETSLNEVINEINKVISVHNTKVANHSTEVLSAQGKLELHYLGAALLDHDYPKYERNIKKAIFLENKSQETLEKNLFEIQALEQKTSNIGHAVSKINQHLVDFFGREEIKLEMDEAKKGYKIKRDGQFAKNLSEGEKTAIAFSYFVVKVEEKGFGIDSGIVFIDDPISSLDSNYIYHCFSLISTKFNNVGQLFISTHNFQLFNLVKGWLIGKNNKTIKDNRKLAEKKRPEKKLPCEFYMVENYIKDKTRNASVVKLDQTLLDYKSEYHFLFSLLNRFKDQVTDYSDFYTIGNVARRFFDIFADFKIPDMRDPRQKMETLVIEINKEVDEADKIRDSGLSKAYKLINEFSHNSDPTSSIEHKDKTESREAIRILLDIVKKSDPKHYKILEGK